MKRIFTVLAAVAVAVAAESATVVLRGGKQIEVASFEQKGNLLILKHEDGSVVSYPLGAVDMERTRVANQKPEPSPAAPPSGPHSPFFEARSVPGGSAVIVTDADVQHIGERAEEGKIEEQATTPEGAQVSLVSYDRKKLAEGEWEVTATIVNQGGAPASSISANVRLLALDGKALGSGTGKYEGQLAPKQQGALTVKVAAAGDVGQVGFEFQWVSIEPVRPTPAPAPGLTTPPATAPAPAPAPSPTGYGVVPPGSSPNTVPGNPLGHAPSNQMGAPWQVPPPTAAPSAPPE